MCTCKYTQSAVLLKEELNKKLTACTNRVISADLILLYKKRHCSASNLAKFPLHDSQIIISSGCFSAVYFMKIKCLCLYYFSSQS